MTDPANDSSPSGVPDGSAAGAGRPGPFPGSVDAAVLAHLKAAKRPQTTADLAAALSLPERTVSRALGKLVGERLARKAGGGLFTLAAHPGHRIGRRT